MENTEQRLLRKEELAHQLQVSTRTIDRMIKAGEIKPIQIGCQKRFPESLLHELKKQK